ncbi:MAG: hypothetical protein GY798_12260 [Hyphomicrobiales bacterium]|nr:hypothetical protein [Hyphomicrobiales bacterium]
MKGTPPLFGYPSQSHGIEKRGDIAQRVTMGFGGIEIPGGDEDLDAGRQQHCLARRIVRSLQSAADRGRRVVNPVLRQSQQSVAGLWIETLLAGQTVLRVGFVERTTQPQYFAPPVGRGGHRGLLGRIVELLRRPLGFGIGFAPVALELHDFGTMHHANAVERLCLRVSPAPFRQNRGPLPGANHFLNAATRCDDFAIDDSAHDGRRVSASSMASSIGA